MTDRHAFLRAIKDHPDDDTPRLVFADWLDEHGESELADEYRRAVAAADDAEYVDAAGFGRCDRMPGDGWQAIGAGKSGAAVGVNFYRGGEQTERAIFSFRLGAVARVVTSWAVWREHGDRLYEVERPWRVRLTTRPVITVERSPDGFAEYRLPDRDHRIGVDELRAGVDPAEQLCRLEWPGTDFEIHPAGHRYTFRNDWSADWPDHPFITPPGS